MLGCWSSEIGGLTFQIRKWKPGNNFESILHGCFCRCKGHVSSSLWSHVSKVWSQLGCFVMLLVKFPQSMTEWPSHKVTFWAVFRTAKNVLLSFWFLATNLTCWWLRKLVSVMCPHLTWNWYQPTYIQFCLGSYLIFCILFTQPNV